MLYEPNIKLSDLTFEDLFFRMRPRIEFHCHNNEGLIKGFEFDDLFQELSCKLWKARLPDDIIYFDWRFLKYMDTSFRFCIYDLSKKKITKKKLKNNTTVIVFRDILDNSVMFCEELNK
jgi:hypothetical protein